ncbi:hypothetical protein [Aquimarina longa]|uniref:hypothetical protein n=1 Tax=Aquimarina longa TaxID=1080221 RepID=UPI000781D604|nr:hypothetical protein [Aquimarina longa]
MKELQYYKFRFHPTEMDDSKSKSYQDLQYGKLYSDMTNKYESEDYIERKFFFPKDNGQYSADQRIPNQEIEFYEFYLKEICDGIDDFMYTIEINSSLGFFVSPRCKEFLKKFELPSHKYYPVKISLEEDYECYYLLIAKEELHINYEQSTFVEMFDETQEVPVAKYQDLLQLNPANEVGPAHYNVAEIEEEIIVFDIAPDIYPVVTSANGFFYFSERLKLALEQEGMTGFKLYEAEKPKFFLAD